MANNDYSANDILNFEYPKSIWKRTSMYLGERGTQQSVGVREIIDNAVHEVVRGFADKVKITFGKDKSVTVQDNGRGLPVDTNDRTGKNGIILCMATLHAGANFKTNIAAGKAGAGLNGVGASATNAVSKRFDVEVYKSSKKYELSFQNGYAGHFETINDPNSKFTRDDNIIISKDTRPTAEKKDFKTGTIIKLWFNEDRFPKDEAIDVDDLINRLKYIAYLVPGITIDIIDETHSYEDGSFHEWHFHSDNGLPEMVEVVNTTEILPESKTNNNNIFTDKGIYYLQTAGNYSEMATNEEGKIVEAERTVTAEIAFCYNTGYDKNITSFVNTIHTHLGGVHEKAFEKALVKVFSDRMNSMRGINITKDNPPILDDFLEGLTVVLSVNIPEPQFIGQQKDKISGPEVEKALTKAFTETLITFVNSSNNQKIIKPIFEKIVNASKNRKAATDAKLAKRKATQVSSSAMPAKLADCDLSGTDESEILICEGDSAAGTIKKARDATYQAVIPIRGKILNCVKASNAEILKNNEIMDIAKALGAGFGTHFDVDNVRYGKIIFAADADHDGLHICNLLYSVFNRLFKELIIQGRVYQAVPPLFEITVGSGKNTETIYVVNESELNQTLKKLEKENKTYKIERNKGLGEMEPDAFYDTVLDPSRRTLRRIVIEDVEKAEKMLLLTLGKDNSQERKDYMTENFQTAIDTGLVVGFEEGNE